VDGDKVGPEHRFLDLSDYARPVARVLTRALVRTPVTPIHVTLTYTLVGLIAAVLYAQGTYLSGALSGVLLLVKSTLDAVDGSLARARSRPSRVGRLLDSLLDFVVNVAVFISIALPEANASGSPFPLSLAVAALVSATWQGTAFNYYSVAYRQHVGGETTSKLDESVGGGMPWDDPRALHLLLTLYALVYGWQDRWTARLDGFTAPHHPAAEYTDRRFLTAVSAMGLGTQLALIALCSWLGRPIWALYLFVGPFNLYWGGLIAYRYTKYRNVRG
jgi:phosphatidylglycerophosphate synthase